MILGTAGHVDHGKTALVKALTGVDTDRLAEEKRRGITIDLGFAPLTLDDGTVLGVVDVPGHEAFVRNMLAGATGVDLALLVVAADEGVMPQTREHLAILDLLGLRAGVIALTKCDLAEPDWLELVREDVRALVAHTPLAAAPVVPTSVVTGEGLDALRRAIADAACALPARDASDLFRLPVDRAFSVRGTGTVVTGTVWSGQLARDATVRLLPGARTARVRGIESHGAAVAQALPGTRAAIALAGVEVGELHRGTTLVADAGWTASRALLAEVALLDDAPRPLGPRTAVRFHLGTMEVGARIVTAGGALAPGERKQARVVLDEPVVARAGDRFVLRSASPLTTIGGGVVNDPAPPHRRARPWPASALTPAARLPHVLAAAGVHGVEVATLAVRLGARPSEVDAIARDAVEHAARVADRLVAARALGELRARALALVEEHHARAPLEPGAPLQSVRARLAAPAAMVDHVVDELVRTGALEVSGALVMRRGWTPALTPAHRATRDALAAALRGAAREPPSVAELEARFGDATPALLRLLEREGAIVQVEADRFYDAGVLTSMLDALRAAMAAGREYGPAELRDVLGLSRKYLIPFLEHCDRIGVTVRRGAGRVVNSV
jgi:selenocysteine-specific elongation factor